ncbi:sel1 repeat family protein [Pseudomonas sp.]|uniref:tetratricopeptide repeat protein n=1 Tax=Pseudomonas sp. TaxID=306 RepID=UPI00289E5999|nr:sel1 repeat family protein [Pseudomonas sp.]
MINKHSFISLAAILLICHSLFAIASLNTEQQAARDKGLSLYQQHMRESAIPYLTIASQAGDEQAQYYLGEAIRLNSMYMTEEAAKWYGEAAKQGNLFAMLRLGSNQDACNYLNVCPEDASSWKEKAIDLASERARKGDSTAMRALYIAGKGLSWLEKAAENNDFYAKYVLAGSYQSGKGWFFLPKSREEAILNLLKSSSEAGYPPAMFEYYSIIKSENNIEAYKWLERSANMGYVDAIIELAANLGGVPNGYSSTANSIKAAALMQLVVELSPEDDVLLYMLNEIKEKLNSAQVKESKELAVTWKKSHPELSYFVPVYGF